MGRSMHDVVVSIILILLSLLTAQAATAAQQPVFARSKEETVQVMPADDAAQEQTITQRVPTGEHQLLAAYQQCGGERGLCERTTLGGICGDRPWSGLLCPEGFECRRQTAALWQCQQATRQNSSQANSSGGQVVPVAKGGAAPVSFNGSGSFFQATDKSNSSDNSATPAVKACPPGQVSVGNICVRPSSSGSKSVTGSTTLLAACQLAVVLAAALLAC